MLVRKMKITITLVGRSPKPRIPSRRSQRNDGLWQWGSDPTPKTIKQLTRHLEKCVDESLQKGDVFTLEFINPKGI